MFFPLVFLLSLRLLHRQIIAEFLCKSFCLHFKKGKSLLEIIDSAESFVHGDSEYIFCGYRVPWNEARIICMSYKAELATLNTEGDSNFIAEAITDSRWGEKRF